MNIETVAKELAEAIKTRYSIWVPPDWEATATVEELMAVAAPILAKHFAPAEKELPQPVTGEELELQLVEWILRQDSPPHFAVVAAQARRIVEGE